MQAIGSQQIPLTHTEGQQRIGAQHVVIVQVLVAQSQREESLRGQFTQRMIAIPQVTPIREASAERLADSILSVNLAQQQRSAIAAEMTAGEISLNGPVEMIVKGKRFLSF